MFIERMEKNPQNHVDFKGKIEKMTRIKIINSHVIYSFKVLSGCTINAKQYKIMIL